MQTNKNISLEKNSKGRILKIEVTHYFNPETGLNVFFNRDNNKFISGWLLRDYQLYNMLNRGAL